MLIKDAAQQAAESTLAGYWNGTFPVKPFTIARAMGLKVFDEVLAPNTSGFIRKRKGEDPVIYIETSDAPQRQNFTCAHEIGHYVERTRILDVPDDDFAFVDLRNGTTNDVHEFFANEYAGNLLMPESEVRRLHERGFDPLRMAGYFGVSVPAMRVRLRRLALD